MTNRHKRRADAARQRSRKGNFYESYLRHLPQVDSLDLSKPGIVHMVHRHDDWCAIYKTGHAADCNCNVEIEFRAEPTRS